MINPWLTLTMQAAWLSWEAQSVIALRLMRLAGGGRPAQSEATGMISEKVAAFSEAHCSWLPYRATTTRCCAPNVAV